MPDKGLREIVACFPVYRTYFGDDGEATAERDREHVARAVAAAKRRSPTTNPTVFDFIEAFYNPRRRHSALGHVSPAEYERRHHPGLPGPSAYPSTKTG